MTLNWKEALSSLVTKSLSSPRSLEPPFPEELSVIIQERMGFAESEIGILRMILQRFLDGDKPSNDEILAVLRKTYCDHYAIMHIPSKSMAYCQTCGKEWR
jgi:hypothetical protein